MTLTNTPTTSRPNRTGIRPTTGLLGRPAVAQEPEPDAESPRIHTLIGDFDGMPWPLAPDRERGLINLINYLHKCYDGRNPPGDIVSHLLRVCPRQSQAFRHLQQRAPNLMQACEDPSKRF